MKWAYPLLCILLCVPSFGLSRLDSLAAAIAQAEGFHVRRSIPSRYHNPGDIKSPTGVKINLQGQVGIGKGRHVIFKSNKDGWEALRAQLTRMAEGRSHNFRPNMTLAQVARKYTGDDGWRAWTRIVSARLGVPADTTLQEYLQMNGPPDVPMCMGTSRETINLIVGVRE